MTNGFRVKGEAERQKYWDLKQNPCTYFVNLCIINLT